MGVTNCFSANGVLLGEDGPNGKADYLTDALGSVCTTVNQVGAVLNTYRYKPSGSQLSKTGSSPDPAFLWVGTMGYRATALSWSGTYVRRRHYSTESGAWTTVDPFWPAESAYVYVNGRPCLDIDPTGHLSWRVTVPPARGNCCGLAVVQIIWQPAPPEYGKWIIQEIINTGREIDCLSGGNYFAGYCPGSQHYYERWYVNSNGTVYIEESPGVMAPWNPCTACDTWAIGMPCPIKRTYGNFSKIGYVGVGIVDNSDWSFGAAAIACAGGLPTATKLSTPFNPTYTRVLSTNFDRCSVPNTCECYYTDPKDPNATC